MPEIARFHGIVIRMYAEPGVPHHRPHFHAYYQNSIAVYAVYVIEIIAGSMPRRQHRLVEAWAQSTRCNEMNPMKHGIYRVVAFDVMRPFTLRVKFDDGTDQVIDFSPILEGNLYGPLRDLSLFNQVRLDHEVHTLVWPNGADFDPATLHDWPDNLPTMKAMAQRWANAAPPS